MASKQVCPRHTFNTLKRPVSVPHRGRGSSYNTRQTGGITAVFLFSFNDPSAWEEAKSRVSGVVILGINSLQTHAHAFFKACTPFVLRIMKEMQPICTNADHARARTENKLRKVLVEKMHRDRINISIEHLRMIFCPIMQVPEEQAAKLEKADILEMAVTLLWQKACSRANSSFARGFSQCLHEMLRHVSLHAHLPPKDREEIKRFYVLQRISLKLGSMLPNHSHLSQRSPKRTASRNRVALWRPWKKN